MIMMQVTNYDMNKTMTIRHSYIFYLSSCVCIFVRWVSTSGVSSCEKKQKVNNCNVQSKTRYTQDNIVLWNDI